MKKNTYIILDIFAGGSKVQSIFQVIHFKSLQVTLEFNNHSYQHSGGRSISYIQSNKKEIDRNRMLFLTSFSIGSTQSACSLSSFIARTLLYGEVITSSSPEG